MTPGAQAARAMERSCIFIIEADDVIRSALQFMLLGDNEVHTMASLERAQAKSQDSSPRLVLLGLSVVRRRGVATLADVLVHFPDAKILLVADRTDEALASACLAAGAHDVLDRPIGVGAVRKKVDALLGSRKLDPRAASGGPRRLSN